VTRERRPPRAEATSDVRRVATMLVAAVLALVTVALLAWAAPAGRLASPGPLGAAHTRAGVACADCHRDQGPSRAAASADACVRCHGAHSSTRPGHRAMQATGALTCATCHRAHGGAADVTLASGATVPLVPIAACRGCHDGARPRDPLRACTTPGRAPAFSLCMDEHQRPSSPLPARGVCARQHGAARFVAWEAARAAAVERDPPPSGSTAAPWLWVTSSLGAGGLGFAGAAFGARLRRRRSAAASNACPAPAARVRLPQIDATSCLGCQACVDACPFDVLAVDRHVAVVARPDECCGVGSCELVCPNGSLRLAEEGAPPGERPRVDAHLESLDAPGVFVAGDLTGVPLIRNAIVQGARVAERVAERRAHAAREESGRPADGVDLAVVGAGPAGLSAALRAKQLGLSCVVLEQSTLAASIRSFPRGKVVHDAPLQLPLEGALWLRECTKEELLAQWTRIVRVHRIEVREGHRVTGVERIAGAVPAGPRFVVRAEAEGAVRTLRAAHVLLAVGRRGTPRRLSADVAPSAASRVLYALSDARALAGRAVLVVGLGDSAMEAVIALARQPGTTVTVSYRGAGFARGRARNVEQVERLVAAGRVRVVFGSTVARVDDAGARLRTAAGEERVPADVVLTLIGGEPSRALLRLAGVRLEGE